MQQKPPPSVWGPLALMGQLGFTIAVPIALLAILGNYLDNWLRTGHLFILLGLLLGLISGIYGAYRLFKRTQVL
ncbi:MAG: AtpZ/AtpI family protein [Chloroflexi bacterium]|nr:MAG: AtpZ/AtpI family protein [Chloroflexota bacterium]